jgi:multidrug efflux system outer membrane protein
MSHGTTTAGGSLHRWVAAVLLTGGATGCALGPDPTRPETAAVGVYSTSTETTTPPIPQATTWWKHIGDPATEELVLAALASNTDLRSALARVAEADSRYRQAQGARWPEVRLGADASRTKNAFTLPDAGLVSSSATTYAGDVAASYPLDLFGRLKRDSQRAQAGRQADQAALEALYHTIVAQVIRSRVQIATLENASRVAEAIRESWSRTLEVVERRYQKGLLTSVDLYLARENLSASKAVEVEIGQRRAEARHALDVLIGKRPGTGAPLPATLAELPPVEPTPPGLPIDLLERRPDVRQAELNLAAATYGIGVALADLFPSVTLTGSAGGRSETLGDLFTSDATIYQAVAGVTAPLFTGGRRRAAVDGAKARAEQAGAAYAGVVLQALRDVEDALASDAATAQRVDLNRQRLEEARSADALARQRFDNGVETLLRVLETERRLRSAEEAWITAKSERWNARINLYLALGGDWEFPVEWYGMDFDR